MERQEMSGFTIVEVIVSLVVVSLFLAILTGVYQALSTAHISATRYTQANSIAQANLSKYRSVSDITATCSDTDTSTVLLSNDSNNAETPPEGNFYNFSQEVRVQWKRGCSQPPTVLSTISYGPTESREVISRTAYAL